jgi:hypothetical protein
MLRARKPLISFPLFAVVAVALGATLASASSNQCLPIEQTATYARYLSGLREVRSGDWQSAFEDLQLAMRGFGTGEGFCPGNKFTRSLYAKQSAVYEGLALLELGRSADSRRVWAAVMLSSPLQQILKRANAELLRAKPEAAFRGYEGAMNEALSGQAGASFLSSSTAIRSALKDARDGRTSSAILVLRTLKEVRYADFLVGSVQWSMGSKHAARGSWKKVLFDEDLVAVTGPTIILDQSVLGALDLLSRSM